MNPPYATLYPHYFSTYCIHANHAQCRMTCKTCQQPCRCSCHLLVSPTMTTTEDPRPSPEPEPDDEQEQEPDAEQDPEAQE